jgi:hypothetical protein
VAGSLKGIIVRPVKFTSFSPGAFKKGIVKSSRKVRGTIVVEGAVLSLETRQTAGNLW